MTVPIYRIENFIHGIVDAVEDKSIPPGSARKSRNWRTSGDRIELRGGYRIIGADAGRAVAEKVTGLFTGHTIDDTEVVFRKRARMLEYYDSTTELWREIGTNLFPAAASAEDVHFTEIKTQAGAQVWCSSPNSGLYKIMVNSGKSGSGFVEPTAKDNYDSSKNHKGVIKIKRNRILLWQKVGDVGGIRGSYIDSQTYTTVSNESLGTGDAATKTFAGTLSAVTGKRTCFALVVDAVVVGGATETFTDNRDGTLTSNLGGAGTINYSSGAISVTFFTAPDTAQGVLADYQWEDSTSGGLADFTESGTRLAGEGFYQPQGDGGVTQTAATYGDIEYCLHAFKTWSLDITVDDTNANNQLFRDSVGIPTPRAAVATGDGIYHVNDRGEGDPTIDLLTLERGSTAIVPKSRSANIDLTKYVFDDAAMYNFDPMIVVLCRTADSVDSAGDPVNNRMLVFDTQWGSWDEHDYYGRMLATFDGALIVGDSLSGNVLEVFSGFDDDDATISDNYWEGNLDEMQIRELKKSRTLRIEGEIQSEQAIEVSLSVDKGDYVLMGYVDGQGGYVDIGSSISVGSSVLGRHPIGGSSSAEEVTAYHYLREMSIRQLIDKFQRASIRFRSVPRKDDDGNDIDGSGIGYASVSSYEFNDITRHGSRIPSRYNV